MVVPATELHNLPILGRLSGTDVLAWLRSERGINSWWLCYDADEYLLEVSAPCCLAHHIGVGISAFNAAWAETGLVGKGVKAARRAAMLQPLG